MSTKNNTGKFIGSTMILIGTIIGAGMLALPMVGAKAGFFWASILIFTFWVTTAISGLFVVETNLAMPKHACSFSSMAEQTLGIYGKIVTWISYLFLLYAVITAYIIGETDLLVNAFSSTLHLDVPIWIISITFTLVLGTAVFWSTKAVDYFNRGFFSIKGILLLATLVLIIPHVDVVKLVTSQSIEQSKYLCLAAPAFLCAFGYHFVIPSLRLYIGDKPKQLRTIVIVGGLTAVIIYILWLAAVLGTVALTGENSFATLAKTPGSSVGKLTQLMISIINNRWVTNSINIFTNVAMTTSFLGVALSLFDFLADGLKRRDNRFGRFQTATLTFIPPLLFALFYPQGFIVAINYAAIPMAMLALILPALMVYKLRKSKTLKSPYRVKCGNIVIALLILLGIISIVLALMSNLGILENLLSK